MRCFLNVQVKVSKRILEKRKEHTWPILQSPFTQQGSLNENERRTLLIFSLRMMIFSSHSLLIYEKSIYIKKYIFITNKIYIFKIRLNMYILSINITAIFSKALFIVIEKYIIRSIKFLAACNKWSRNITIHFYYLFV